MLIPSRKLLTGDNPNRPGSSTLSLLRHTFLTRAWPIWARYTVTVLAVIAALGFSLVLPQHLPGTPFLPFFLAIIICSALFDHGSGIVAVLLSAALAKWYLIAPIGHAECQQR